jgi:protein gp37
MGTNSGIDYVDHSLNFWVGCTKVRPELGCKNCYAEREMKRYGRDFTKVVRTSRASWRQPLVKSRKTGDYKWKSGDYVFVCSWSDFFHPAGDQWRDDAWRRIYERPDLIWIIVTKRVERAFQFLRPDWWYKKIIIVATIENQQVADRDIPKLLKLKSKFKGLRVGVSLEPMLGPVDFLPFANMELRSLKIPGEPPPIKPEILSLPLDWVIVGGESGPGARPLHPDWVRSVRDQCKAAGVPFFFKQWGRYYPVLGEGIVASSSKKVRYVKPGPVCMFPIGKKAAGCLLDGREHKERPE